MGAQKLLLPFKGKTMIEQVVDTILASGINDILLTVGEDGDRIVNALTGRKINWVTNPNPDGDMLSSVRCGWRALPAKCKTVLVALGDQPTISSSLIRELLTAFSESGCGICVPFHHGQRGHPILVSARYREEILTQHDAIGLRGLLGGHPEEVYEWSAPTSAVLLDLDTPEDYRRALIS